MKKKTVSIILIIVIVLAGINFYSNIRKIHKLKSRIEKLNHEITLSMEKQNKLKEQLENVNDEEFIESVARTKLGLVKPGEVLVIPIKEKNENEK